jgi:disulfide bond formation protein DsbB
VSVQYNQYQQHFERFAESQWAHLSRLTNLLIILNISLFFLTDLVTQQGYYYTFYSLICLAAVFLGPLLPFGLLGRLWYYLVFLAGELMGVYFLVASIWYWVKPAVPKVSFYRCR